jgi:hypothetical protein
MQRDVPKGTADVEGQHVIARSEQLRQVLDVFVAAGALLGIIVDAAVVVHYALLGAPGSSIDAGATEEVLAIRKKGLVRSQAVPFG